MNPPFPPSFDIDVEEFRHGILDTRLPYIPYL